jgi:hypothetical protein
MSLTTTLVGAALVLVQALAALPWLAAGFLTGGGRAPGAARRWLLPALGVLAGALAAGAVFPLLVQQQESLEVAGRIYGAVLQAQLTVDLFVLIFALLLAVWPKGGAVALASFREGVRQPMYWLLAGIGLFLMTISPFIPYFTFGEDYTVVKELGYDLMMLMALLFGALAASMFVSEEIEGRTAVTLLSKPVSRRQFLLGKYAGILLACLLMFGLLGLYFEGVLLYKHWFDRMDAVPVPEWLTLALVGRPIPSESADLLRGVGLWASHTLDTLPGLVLSFAQVMVLVAVAVALATRVPMVVNLTTVLVVFFLSHLTPVLVRIGKQAQAESPGPVSQLLGFVAQLMDTVLPDLEAFRIGPALVSDAAPPAGALTHYLASVSLYGLMYTGIVLLFGLILFEDRDLA